MAQTASFRYTVPSVDGEGWGVFLLDQSGVFTAVTDFGNFAHWFSLRENESIGEFLLSRRPDQILCKIANEDVVDIKETIKYIKENLLNDRREGRFTEAYARAEWKLIEELQEDLEEYSNDVAFQYWYDKTHIQFDEGFYQYKYPNAAVRFSNETFVRFQEKLKEDLKGAQA
ncbi:hypothetical protein LKL98_21245 [Bacillus pacificus]|uniref:hypothetical protein n=1 Tax=Bacillus pacificus TaxID=2026187 RepID=UPI001E4425AA|nr:hypothetical protein [Bacillus pacificus]MCC2473549.1 hypothetical protein [Bacillus pacificus]